MPPCSGGPEMILLPAGRESFSDMAGIMSTCRMSDLSGLGFDISVDAQTRARFRSISTTHVKTLAKFADSLTANLTQALPGANTKDAAGSSNGSSPLARSTLFLNSPALSRNAFIYLYARVPTMVIPRSTVGESALSHYEKGTYV
jgi:hypothetical protein